MPPKISPENALIFRIVHRVNLPWILDNGIHARNGKLDPNYRNIGNAELIGKRAKREVLISPGGVLNDYVPFYFTPYSIMMLNIKTGHSVPRQPNEDILIFVSSLPHIAQFGLPFIFTNQHAYPQLAQYYGDIAHLDKIDWPLLQSRDFKHDPDDPGKKERYQAEALIWKLVPLDAVLGICCNNNSVNEWIQAEATKRGMELKTVIRPNWYF